MTDDTVPNTPPAPVTPKPQPGTRNKLINGGLSGAVVIIMVWLAKQFGNVDIPDYVQNALGIVITLAVAHLTPTDP